MEPKTIGGFISALRKASGMTQKDLAEKLNVSDKTVSRWERNEGFPDLSLIPVIAEIFGVTCDELLRGERRPPHEDRSQEEDNSLSPKGEKQRKRLLDVCLSKYRSGTFISAGISVSGLVAAAICNYAFLKGLLGFFAGTVFYIVSIVCQSVFLNKAMLTLSEEDSSDSDVNAVRRNIIKLTKVSFCFTALIFAFTLPLLITGFNTGLTSQWFLTGSLCSAICLILCLIANVFLSGLLLKRGTIYLSEKEHAAFDYNRKLRGRCMKITAALAVPLAVLNIIVTVPPVINDGIRFDDYDSFKTYMETETPPLDAADSNPFTSEDHSVPVELPPPGSSLEDERDVIYYNEQGEEISREEALTRTIKDNEGNVLLTYLELNENVCGIRYSVGGDGNALPIYVKTYDSMAEAKETVLRRNIIFGCIYAAIGAGAVICYYSKRKKI